MYIFTHFLQGQRQINLWPIHGQHIHPPVYLASCPSLPFHYKPLWDLWLKPHAFCESHTPTPPSLKNICTCDLPFKYTDRQEINDLFWSCFLFNHPNGGLIFSFPFLINFPEKILYYFASFPHPFQSLASCKLTSMTPATVKSLWQRSLVSKLDSHQSLSYSPGHSWHCRSLPTWYFLSLGFHERLGWALLSFYPKSPVQMLLFHICPLNVDFPRVSLALGSFFCDLSF